MNWIERLLLIGLWSGLAATRAPSQTSSNAVAPYATLDRAAVHYAGPGRDRADDLPGNTAVVGLILPLQGKRAEEGSRLLRVAQRAVDDELANNPLPDGRQIRIAVSNENEHWGQTSSDIVSLIEEEHALALVTLYNGETAHLTEQIANKLGVPVLTLASDPAITATNIPWVFRFGPSDHNQAMSIVSFLSGKPRNVLLITERDYDGRVGKSELMRALRDSNAQRVSTMEMGSQGGDESVLREQIARGPVDVAIVWTSPYLADHMVETLRERTPETVLVLSRKAAQTIRTEAEGKVLRVISEEPEESNDMDAASSQLQNAILSLVKAIREQGLNRTRIRDYFVQAGGKGEFHFDAAGNALAHWVLAPVGKWATPSEAEALTRTHLPQGRAEK